MGTGGWGGGGLFPYQNSPKHLDLNLNFRACCEEKKKQHLVQGGQCMSQSRL